MRNNKNCSICRIAQNMHRIMCEIFLVPVRLYRRFVSPLKAAPCCRFTPTCSQYAIDAVREWGIVIGFILALWRVIRCNPFSDGGYDPVPKRRRRS